MSRVSENIGTVTTVSVATANGFGGTVANPTTTPVITILPQSEYASDGRLTLTSGTSVTTSDVTAATTLYFALHNGDYVGLYDGTVWHNYQFTELSIKATDSAQTGTMISGQKTITGLTSTAQLVRGMQVTGTSIGAAAVISTIDSATQVTVNVNSTGSTTNAVTFKLPASTAYDVLLVWNGGTPRLQFSNPWTNLTTPADAIAKQNGVYVNASAINAADNNTIAAKTGRRVGGIFTTTTAGQMEDSVANSYVSNQDNRVQRKLKRNESTSSWTYNSTTVRQANANTSNQVNLFSCDGFSWIDLRLNCSVVGGGTVNIGINSTTTSSSDVGVEFDGGNTVEGPSVATYVGVPRQGQSSYMWLESARASTTFYNTIATSQNSSGLIGSIMN